jgi:hypothetical protein
MNGGDGGEPVELHFAILDGSNPRSWIVFNKPFFDLVNEVTDMVTPYAVSDTALATYRVRFQVIWSSPSDLINEKRLRNVVGVIIDALPKDTLQDDLLKKKETLRTHLGNVRKHCSSDSNAALNRFGYSVWFITNDPRTISSYRAEFNDLTHSVIGPANFQYLTEERLLGEHLAAYMSNIYNILERGR